MLALGKLFGPSLLWWRLLRVAADATAALLVYLLVRDRRPRLGAPGVGGSRRDRRAADEREPHRPRARVRPRRRSWPRPAGVQAGRASLAALAAFWRPDVGAIAALAAAATLLVASRREEAGAAPRGAVTTAGPPTAGTAVPARPSSSGTKSQAEAPSSSAAASRAEAPSPGAAAPSAAPPPDVAGPTAAAPGAAARPRLRRPTSLGRRRRAGRRHSRRGHSTPRATSRRAAATCLAVAAVGLLVLYAPFLVAAGPGRVWDALVVQATKDGEWWRLPFGYGGGDAKDFVTWLLPFAAVVTLRVRPPGVPSGWSCSACGAAVYFASRADLEHAQGLLIVAAAAAAFARPRVVGATLLALLLAVGLANRASALLRPPDLRPFEQRPRSRRARRRAADG